MRNRCQTLFVEIKLAVKHYFHCFQEQQMYFEWLNPLMTCLFQPSGARLQILRLPDTFVETNHKSIKSTIHLVNEDNHFEWAPLRCLAGYYHINDGHLLETKNKQGVKLIPARNLISTQSPHKGVSTPFIRDKSLMRGVEHFIIKSITSMVKVH